MKAKEMIFEYEVKEEIFQSECAQRDKKKQL